MGDLAKLIADHRKASSPKIKRIVAAPSPRSGVGRTLIGPGGIPIRGLLYDPDTGVFWRTDGKSLNIKSRNSLNLDGLVSSGNALNMAEAALRTCHGEVPGKRFATFIDTSNRDYEQNPSAYALGNLRWDSKRQNVPLDPHIMRPIIRRWADGAGISVIAREFGYLTHSQVKQIIEGTWGNRMEALRDSRHGYEIHLDPDRVQALRDREKAGLPEDTSAKWLRQLMAKFPFPRTAKPKVKPKKITLVEAEAIFVAWERGGSFNKIALEILGSTTGSHSVQFLIEGCVASGATIHEVYESRRKDAVLNRATASYPKDNLNKSLQKLRARYGI